jgi:hypothetical protein
MNRRPTQTAADILFGRLGRTKDAFASRNDMIVLWILTIGQVTKTVLDLPEGRDD